jgi:hypothetical protein
MKSWSTNKLLKEPKNDFTTYLVLTEVVKSVMGPYCRQYFILFFPFVCPWPIHLFLKRDGWCPDTLWTHVMHVWNLYWTHSHYIHHNPTTCITGPKVCMGKTMVCLGPPNMSWMGKRAIREKSRQYLAIDLSYAPYCGNAFTLRI